MTTSTFKQKFSEGITPQTLHSFRKIKKEYIYRFKNFAGESIAVPVQNTPLGKTGFRVPMETSRIVNDEYFSGSPHNKLMSAPRVLYEKEGFITRCVDRLALDLAKRLLYEHGKEFSQEDLSVVNTLVRADKLRPDIKEELYMREQVMFRGLIE